MGCVWGENKWDVSVSVVCVVCGVFVGCRGEEECVCGVWGVGENKWVLGWGCGRGWGVGQEKRVWGGWGRESVCVRWGDYHQHYHMCRKKVVIIT